MFRDKKFQLLLLDAAISLIILVAGRYLLPDDYELVIAVVAILQPVFVALISAQARVEVAVIQQMGKMTMSGDKAHSIAKRGP